MFENVFSHSDVADFRIWMDWADRFAILTHAAPDGDAIGSSLALCHYLKSKGKDVSVIVPDQAPDFLSWMPGFGDIMVYDKDPDGCESVVYKSDVVCCLDFNAVGRIDKVAACFLYTKAKKILLDHHPFPGPNWDVTLSHPELSSTSEMVFQFICSQGDFKSITKEMATCIFTGIMTDTGCFAYSSSSPSLFRIAAMLLELGVDKDAIHSKVMNSYSESRLRLQGFVLNERMQVFKDDSTALISLSDADMKRFEFKKGDTEGFVNMPLQIMGIRMSVFLREDKLRGIVRLSARSVGNVPCNRFASDFFGGGGHLNAAGGEFDGTLEQAVERFKYGMEQWRLSQEECISQLFNSKKNE